MNKLHLRPASGAPPADVKMIEQLVVHIADELKRAWAEYDYKTMVGFVRGSPGGASAKLAIGWPESIEVLLERDADGIGDAARAIIRDALDQVATQPTTPHALRALVAWHDEANMYFVSIEPTGKAKLN